MVTMTGLPDGWESDYDGTRWFYRYTATGSVQYHFPQPGDEYAEFLVDAGTGPFQLTPEESLAIEQQQTKRRSISGSEDDTTNSTKTSGSKREKKKIQAIEEEDGMSATGYFDPSSFMYFPGNNNISPVGNEDAGETSKARPPAVELPEGRQQTWSPVGFVAELATQETLKCAEELAPVELDATTTFTPPPIQTKVSQEPAELPTNRTPSGKAPEPNPTQPVMQPVDSYPLVSASFAYPPLKPDMNRVNSVSSRSSSIKRKPVSSSAKPADLGQNNYQPWTPAQGAVEQQRPAQNNAPGPLPQTSVLQNQDSELGNIGGKDSGNADSPMSGDVPDALAPPSAPNNPIPVESSNPNPDASSVPTALQPVHYQTNTPVPSATANHPLIPGTKARHDSISNPIMSQGLSHTPSVLRPGNSQPNSSIQGSEGNPETRPQRFSVQYTQQTVISHRPSEQVASSSHSGQPGIIRVNTLPDHLASASPSPPKANGSPGFLLFHEIPNIANLSKPSNNGTTQSAEEVPNPALAPHASNSSSTNLQSSIDTNEPIPVVAPLNFIKRHSSKSSGVSSIASEAQDSSFNSGKPVLTPPPSDQISEVISVIDSLTPQGTPEPSSQPSRPPTQTASVDGNKPSPPPMSGGAGGRPDVDGSIRPQLINAQSPPPVVGMQQSGAVSHVPGQVFPTATNVIKPAPVGATPMVQSTMISPPSNAGIATTQSRPPNTQATHYPPPPVMQNPNASPPHPSQPGIPGKMPMPSGPVRPPGHTSNPSLTQIPGTIPPSQASNITHSNQLQQPVAHGNFPQYMNNTPQQIQTSMPASAVNRPPQNPAIGPAAQQAFHQQYGQSNAPPHSVARPPSTFGHPQVVAQNQNFQQAGMVKPSGQQSTVQSPVGHQVFGQTGAQIPPPPPLPSSPPHQQSSPTTQPVSPLQSQVSSPAQSIASLHISQASTPSNAFATMNPLTGPNNGTNVNTSQAAAAPGRPPSVPNQAFTQQGGQMKPPVNSQSIPPPPPNPPVKPYPMLPGQVTPLPSQVGSASLPQSTQQPMPNNYAKPPVNTQQAPVGQQPMQAALGSLPQHQGMQFQTNPMPYSPQGNVAYGPSPPGQMKPPQQQTPSPHPSQVQAVGQQPMTNQPQPQQTIFQPTPVAPAQPYNPQMAHPGSAGSSPMVGQQYQFAPPPVAAQGQQPVQSPGVTSPTQGKPSTSAQASAAFSDFKKWGKKMWKNPAIKQTAAGFGGAFVAESMGISGAAGAHLGASLAASANRPPLAHAQTAPAQAHGIPGVVSQYQPGKPLPLQQPNSPQGQFQPRPQQPGYPQPGVQPGHPQPSHPQIGQPQPVQPQHGQPQQGQPQVGHPQPSHPQPGHPQPVHAQPGQHQPGQYQTGQPQAGPPLTGHPQHGRPRPGYPLPGPPQPGHPHSAQLQPAHPQPGRPQPVYPQPGQAQAQAVYQQVGVQAQVRPPAVQSSPPAAGVGVNFNAQGQVQVGFTPPQQYPMVRPAMVGTIPPPPPPPPGAVGAEPPSSEAKVQVNIDANVVNAAAAVMSSALRPDHPQAQHAQGSAQGHAQPEHTAHTESHGAENHGSYTGHESATYTDNSYAAADTTYIDNSNYSNNNTYIDNTDVVNTTVYIDNSTAAVVNPTYGNTGYVDTTSYVGTDVTTNVIVDVDVNQTVYTDTGATTFTVDETIDITSTTDVAAASTDYSGSGWGDIEF
ncbi:hypothetical protein F5Y10DRAFT_234057 [Nemania abortiva]|nr:hypothetical protein F5Y10DRAFT_234057 [Nemania abortiva]